MSKGENLFRLANVCSSRHTLSQMMLYNSFIKNNQTALSFIYSHLLFRGEHLVQVTSRDLESRDI